jgi:hypothetical protein
VDVLAGICSHGIFQTAIPMAQVHCCSHIPGGTKSYQQLLINFLMLVRLLYMLLFLALMSDECSRWPDFSK